VCEDIFVYLYMYNMFNSLWNSIDFTAHVQKVARDLLFELQVNDKNHTMYIYVWNDKNHTMYIYVCVWRYMCIRILITCAIRSGTSSISLPTCKRWRATIFSNFSLMIINSMCVCVYVYMYIFIYIYLTRSGIASTSPPTYKRSPATPFLSCR